MQKTKFGEVFKNVAGTVFLLAAAFFACTTFLSMRSVFADPIGGAGIVAAQTAATARGTRASPRATIQNTASRAGGAVTPALAPGRSVASRGIVTNSRAVANRTAAPVRTAARTVVSRNAAPVNAARVSLMGSAIRGGTRSNPTSVSYLSSKLYTGTYSNIIDPSTGLISADAYGNCLESYYTCMDEICTARNAAQRRCACAGRVKAFADAELNLERSNEELIKVSGELALLISTKGKDVSSAFQLTDAEKVMNCVAWRDASQNGTAWTAEYDVDNGGVNWCTAHGIFGNETCSATAAPKYCSLDGNNFGFDYTKLDGNSSDILASLQSWAKSKDATFTFNKNNDDNLMNGLLGVGNIVSGMLGIEGSFEASADLKDSLAETWGYELFEYAHNNVCSRVLDSCFNGIYEACGAPGTNGRKCTNGAASCPFNYNSQITVNNTGTYELNFVTGNTGGTASNSASCFGYTTSTGDPYGTLRGPVADSRRSIMQKYALDANADCDVYGEQLRTTAQNIGYQKVAAQQALQKKRLEFAQEEQTTILADTTAASTNFSECISELYDCYTTQDDENLGRTAWSTSRIKTYCATVANSPSCYNEMICNPSRNQFKMVIDVADNPNCHTSSTDLKNACRNVVTLNEILQGIDAAPVPGIPEIANSAGLREQCIQDALGPTDNGGIALRDWEATSR